MSLPHRGEARATQQQWSAVARSRRRAGGAAAAPRQRDGGASVRALRGSQEAASKAQERGAAAQQPLRAGEVVATAPPCGDKAATAQDGSVLVRRGMPR